MFCWLVLVQVAFTIYNQNLLILVVFWLFLTEWFLYGEVGVVIGGGRVIDEAMVKALVSDAQIAAERIGIPIKKLDDREIKNIVKSFNANFVVPFKERTISDIYERHLVGILVGAMAAKNQMDAVIGGDMPASNEISAPIPLEAAFLGIGDDWDDASPFTTGSPQNWVHSGTTYLGGTAGNDVKIGENAVHVIIGFGSLHPSPKISRLILRLNGKDKPTISTGWIMRFGDLHIKEFSTDIILIKDSTFKAQVMISSAFGSSVEDIPYFLGVSYISGNVLRTYADPANIKSTDAKIISTT